MKSQICHSERSGSGAEERGTSNFREASGRGMGTRLHLPQQPVKSAADLPAKKERPFSQDLTSAGGLAKATDPSTALGMTKEENRA